MIFFFVQYLSASNRPNDPTLLHDITIVLHEIKSGLWCAYYYDMQKQFHCIISGRKGYFKRITFNEPTFFFRESNLSYSNNNNYLEIFFFFVEYLRQWVSFNFLKQWSIKFVMKHCSKNPTNTIDCDIIEKPENVPWITAINFFLPPEDCTRKNAEF